MPRPLRIHLNNVVYYITLEGPYDEPIYKDQADYQKYLDIVSKCKNEFGFKLYAYALLPSQLYLLVEPSPEFSVSKIMQKITPLYTKYYNSRYDRKGPLFLKRFRSVIVEKEMYLPRLTRFIHHLPVHNMLAHDAKSYLFSSYGAYCGASSFKYLNQEHEIGEVRAMLGPVGADQNHYEKYADLADKNEIEFLDAKLSKVSVLGSEHFTAEIRKKIQQQHEEKEEMHESMALTRTAPAISAPLPVFAFSGKTIVIGSLALAFSVCAAFAGFYFRPSTAATVQPAVSAPAPRSAADSLIQKPDLNGTVWEIEMVQVGPDGKETPIHDKIRFGDKGFQSYYFEKQGFNPSNYSVTRNENGDITWETMQSNVKGEVVMWRGDINGRGMGGTLSYHPDQNTSRDFSFLSKSLKSMGVRNG